MKDCKAFADKDRSVLRLYKTRLSSLAKRKKMNKKGYLITIVTVMLLFSLIMLASSYADRLKTNEELYIKATLGDKIRYIEGDIGMNFFEFWEINNITIKCLGGCDPSKAGEYHINMNDLYEVSGLYGPEYEEAIENYENAVEGIYSQKMNSIIKISNFTSGIVIYPYNQTITYDSSNGNFYIYPNPAQVNDTNKYYIWLEVNRLNSDKNAAGTSGPSDNKGISIDIEIKEMASSTKIQGWTTRLDPYQTYAPFVLAFDDGMNLKIYYGMYNGHPGVLRIIRNDPECCTSGPNTPEPVNIKFYKFTEEFEKIGQEIYITNKENSLIDVKIDGLKKEGRIVLAKMT